MTTAPDWTGTDSDLALLEDLAARAATSAGRLVRDERPRDLGVAATKTSATDVVTEMDARSEALLRSLLRAERPDDAVLGEEEGIQGGTSGITWVVDPIDGTVNYLYDIPVYAVSVAAVVGDPTVAGAWAPVAGAVADPARGLLYRARLGGGAWETGLEHSRERPRRLSVNQPSALVRTLLATGFGYRAEDRAWQGRLVGTLLPRVRDIRRAGSAALDLAAVAAGRVDAYAEFGTHAWDVAAGMLLVAEAGGQVSGLCGCPPSVDGVVAAHASVHTELVAAVEELLPPEHRPRG